MRQAAGALGLEFDPIEIRQADDIAPAIDALRLRAQALYVPAVPLFFANLSPHQQLAYRAATDHAPGARICRSGRSHVLWG